MGMYFDRGTAWCDSNYIVNLTTNIIGKRVLNHLAADPSGGRNGHALRLAFWDIVQIEVSKMSSETLGRVCSYGGPKGLHDGPACQVSFINMTGFDDVGNHNTISPAQQNGRDMLEAVAVLTILCVTRDIVCQSEWQANFARDLDDDSQFERGMKDYIHHGQR